VEQYCVELTVVIGVTCYFLLRAVHDHHITHINMHLMFFEMPIQHFEQKREQQQIRCCALFVVWCCQQTARRAIL
jgi:hypothetical protein